VESVDHKKGKVTVRRHSDGHRYTWTIAGGKTICVSVSEEVHLFQVLASTVPPLASTDLVCPGKLSLKQIEALLASRERTQRFTGVKLARLLRLVQFQKAVSGLAQDPEEDIYVRLEALSFLVSVCNSPAHDAFAPFLANSDDQTQLEAVIALGEAGGNDAVALLCDILNNATAPYFLRSAAAWSLSRTGAELATERLIRCFEDVDPKLRDDALEGMVGIGTAAIPALLKGLHDRENSIAAGCAEVLRRTRDLPANVARALLAELQSPTPSPWAIWLVGHLPRDQFATAVASLQTENPKLHFAITLLWSFIESWISRNWEPFPNPVLTQTT
jgi:hypothetical protein